ncbi:MAG: signal peptidase I [Anaerosomatales bacterium]|nr:signal peptidase I [Anaerosomatales bacterium]
MTDRSARYVWARRSLGLLAIGCWTGVAALFGIAVVDGGSMEPALHHGDLALYRRGTVTIERGDIVLFDKQGWRGGVLHRVCEVRDDGSLVTRGDANPVRDRDPVANEHVRGVVVLVVPSGEPLRVIAEHVR